jgi:hypothetical protein
MSLQMKDIKNNLSHNMTLLQIESDHIYITTRRYANRFLSLRLQISLKKFKILLFMLIIWQFVARSCYVKGCF